jgi:hypothetical protein
MTYPYIDRQAMDKPPLLDELKQSYEIANKVIFEKTEGGYWKVIVSKWDSDSNKKWIEHVQKYTKELNDIFKKKCTDLYKAQMRKYECPWYYKESHCGNNILSVQDYYRHVVYLIRKAYDDAEKIRSEIERIKIARERAMADLGELKQIGRHVYIVKNDIVYDRDFRNAEIRGTKRFDSVKEAEEFWMANEEASILAEARRRLAEEERLSAEAVKAAKRETLIQAAMIRLRSVNAAVKADVVA